MSIRIKVALPLIALILLLTSSQTLASYAGNLGPKVLIVAGTVRLGTNSQPAGTCSYYGTYFKFDGTTPSGKNMLSTLLTAKASNKLIDVWFQESTVPGRTQKTGWGGANLAVLSQIAIR